MSHMRKILSLSLAATLCCPAIAAATPAPAPATVPAPAAAPAVTAPAPARTLGCDSRELQRRMDTVLAQAGLATFGGIVTNARGNTYWNKAADRALSPASITKLLTAYTALHVLSPNSRQTTTVSLALDGSLVLRGGGDITISRRAHGATFYRNAPRLSDLAAQVKSKLDRLPRGLRPRRLIVDTSYYTGPAMARGWYSEDIDGGSIAPMAPAMLDGARIYDNGWYVPRTAQPSLQLGATLLQYLGLKGVTVEIGTPAPSLFTLGTIKSAPLEDRIADMLLYSDNVLAESIGREVARATGRPASFRGAADAVLSEIRAQGIPTAGATLSDTSGLSFYNRLSPRTVAEVLSPRSIAEKRKVTDVIYHYLPIAGRSGTLRYRFGGAAAPGQGHVRAKTGSLTGVSTLAGVAYTRRSSTPLYFAFLVSGSNYWAASTTVDRLSTLVYLHGC